MTFKYTWVAFLSVYLSSACSEVLKMHQQNIALLNSSYKESSLKISAETYRYIIVQASSQTKTISMSYEETLEYGMHTNSTSVGLIYMLDEKQDNISAYLAAPQIPTRAQVIAIPYFQKDPIPGGCCTTCAFDNDPNIFTTKETLRVKLFFQRANVNYSPGSQPSACDGGSFDTFKLVYDLYMYPLQENELSENELFDGMWKMASPNNIKYYGSKIGSVKGSKKLLYLLQAIPFQGLVYNIIVRDENKQSEAAYNPVFVYGCDIKNKNSCKGFGSWITITYSVIAGAIGLALCYSGHKFIKMQLFISGLLSSFILVCILLFRFSTLAHTVCIFISTGIGTVFGILLIVLWMKPRFSRLCLLFSSALIGFLIACIIFFSPVGQNEVFSSILVYLLTFLCITFVVPIPLAFFPNINSILFSALYGGFAIVSCCSIFIHAHLQYLILEFIFRAGIPSFDDAYLRVPLQRNDYILCGAWAILFISGAITQYCITKPDKFARRPQGTNGRRNHRRTRSERTPLLQDDNIQYGGTAEYKFQSINSS